MFLFSNFLLNHKSYSVGFFLSTFLFYAFMHFPFHSIVFIFYICGRLHLCDLIFLRGNDPIYHEFNELENRKIFQYLLE